MDAVSEQRKIQFTIDGDELCLDFANTIGSRREPVRETLTGYDRLLQWAEQAQLLAEDTLARLRAEAADQPDAAAAVVADAIRLREAIYRTFSARAGGGVPAASDLRIVNEFLPRALAQRRLETDGNEVRWTWDSPINALDAPLWQWWFPLHRRLPRRWSNG